MARYLIAICLFPAALLAQQSLPHLAVSKIADPLKKGAKTVVRSEDMRFEVSAPDEAELTLRRFVTIFEADTREQEFYVSYNKERRLADLEVNLYDAEGQFIREVAKTEITDESAISSFSIYEDDRVKHVAIKHLQYPFTIETFKRIRYKGILFYPDDYFQKFDQSVEQASYRVQVPAEIDLKFKANVPWLEPRVSDATTNKAYVWEVKNLPALAREPFGPPASELLPMLSLAPSAFQFGEYAGSMSDWATFGKFQYELNKDRDQISPELGAKVRDMTKNLPNNRAKIAALYRYMQENYRYVSVQLGIGGWQTFPASYVEKNKFGDCKALTNFMKSMLRVAGIEAHVAAVSAGDDDFFNPDPAFVDPGFNHVVLYVPSEKMWLECTSRYNPCGYTGAFTDGRRALLFNANDSKLMEIPPLTAANNREESTVQVVLSATGEAEVQVRSDLFGERQDDWRAVKTELSPSDFEEYFRRRCPVNFTKLGEHSVKPEAAAPQTRLEYTGQVRTFAVRSGTRLFVPVNPHNLWKNPLPQATERKQGLVLPETFTETDSVVIQVPADFQVENLPKDVALESEFGSLSMSVKLENGSLVCRRRLTILPVKVSAERYGEVRDFYRKIETSDGGKAVLVAKKS